MSHTVYDPPATVESPVPEREVRARQTASAPPAGPAGAVLLAAGLGSFTLGVLSVLARASAWISDALTLNARVGDLSGVTTVAAIVFFAAWAWLGIAWRHADPPLVRVAVTAAVLVGLGLLGTFPPVLNLIG